MWETVVAVCIGLGLAASCGFRVFVPMLMMSLAAKAGLISLAEGFAWMESWPALAALGLATCLEIGAYYLPWFDNLLDALASPAAVIAGVVVAAAAVTEMDPLLKWSLAVIAGGGAAGTVQLGTTGVRGASTATTGGIGNPLVATLELVGSVLLAGLSILVPVLGALVAAVLVFWLGRFAWRTWQAVRRYGFWRGLAAGRGAKDRGTGGAGDRGASN